MARPVDHIKEQRPIAAENRSLGELFSELTEETTTLVRQEVALAKAEITHKATEVGKDVGFLAAGGLVLYAGFLALVAALIVGLGQAGVPWWVSALIVGILVVAAGGALVWSGLNSLRHVSPLPQATVDSIREDQQWMKDQMR